MRLDTISADDWKQFKNEYGRAYSFLLRASLKGEYRTLKGAGYLNAWEIERLLELEQLKTLFQMMK